MLLLILQKKRSSCTGNGKIHVINHNKKETKQNIKHFLITDGVSNNNKFFEATGNPKKTWELINQILGSIKKSAKPQFIINNERIIERRVIANEFNKYFVSLASKLNEKATPVTNEFGDFLQSGNMRNMFMEDCTGF